MAVFYQSYEPTEPVTAEVPSSGTFANNMRHRRSDRPQPLGERETIEYRHRKDPSIVRILMAVCDVAESYGYGRSCWFVMHHNFKHTVGDYFIQYWQKSPRRLFPWNYGS